MIKNLLLTSTLVILFSCSKYLQNQAQNNSPYQEWKNKFGIQLSQFEDQYRQQIFNENLNLINIHNSDETQTYKMGINQFMHLTKDQFISLYLIQPQQIIQIEESEIKLDTPIKASIDYRNFTRVKEQGLCGSGWAFSVTGTMEVVQQIYYSRNVSLSEQQLIDCDTLSRGCTDGSNYNGYRFAVTYGLSTSEEYPYIGQNQTCLRQYGTYKPVRYNSAVGEYNMKQALNHHPVSAGLDAQNWQFYQSGIFSNCGITFNHYAVVVGYEESGNWILKNSWGTHWGEDGFIRIKSGNTCGVLSYAYQDQYQ